MAQYKVIGKKGNELFPRVSLHPGEVLNDELAAREIKKSDFAAKLGLRPAHLSDLLHGKRHISAAIALKLERLLDVKAEYWLRLQMYYDLSIEREKFKAAA